MTPQGNPNHAISTDELLAEMGWVRALARRLVKDVQSAEDLAQETLLRALESKQRPSSVRLWLGGVLRNLNRNRGRAHQQRVGREQAYGEPGAGPSVSEVLERVALQRELVDLVLGLEEPYRGTLLLRFYGELTQAQIGERMGVPASTVATRLERGLKRLRSKFDGDVPGANKNWMALLLPLCSKPLGGQLVPQGTWPSATSLPISTSFPLAILMSVQAKVLLSVAAVLGAVLLWRGARSERPALALDESQAMQLPLGEISLPSAEQDQLLAVDLEPAMAKRVVQEAQAAMEWSKVLPAEPQAPLTIAGRVIDLQGIGVQGVQLKYSSNAVTPLLKVAPDSNSEKDLQEPPESGVAVTGTDGEFEIDASSSFFIEVDSESHVTVLSPFGNPGDKGISVVVAPRMGLTGVVLDSVTGEPLPDTSLALINTEEAINRLGIVEDQMARKKIHTESDEHGRFRFVDAAYIEGSKLIVRHAGYEHHFIDIESAANHELTIELKPSDEPELVYGIVLRPDGSPARGALISGGGLAVTSARNGRFVLDPNRMASGERDPTEPLSLIAVLAGAGVAEFELPPSKGASKESWPLEVVMQLGGEFSGLSGRVVDHDGSPIKGVNIGLLEMTNFGLVMDGPGGQSGSMSSVEDRLNSGLWGLESDAEGRFEITHLLQRSYKLEFFEPKSGRMGVSRAFPAGSRNIELRVELGDVGPLAGLVVNPEGAPIAGVGLTLSRASGKQNYRMGKKCTTDESGRFAFKDVDREVTGLSISGAEVQFEIHRLIPEDQNRGDLRLVLSRRCSVQFDWEAWSDSGNTLRIVDRDNQAVNLGARNAYSMTFMAKARISNKLSMVFVLPEDAEAAVIMQGEDELGRVPLHLVPGEIQRIKL